jgi:N-methylhydantoinase A
MDSLILGVDTGGTFTDFVLLDGQSIKTWKTLSTPDDPSRAILRGVDHFFSEAPEELNIIHGSTVATNAFLERKGARTLFITTWGFEDVLFIGRQNRRELYNLLVEKPAEIIPRSMIIGVKERILHDGSVFKRLGKSVGKRLRAICRKNKIESVVVGLLHSYVNDTHEQAIKEELLPLNIPITLSSEILPEFREYERFCTSVINGYLNPVMSRYLERLQGKLPDNPISIQLSNGGVLPASEVADRAVYTILSGPAGGVHGAAQIAEQVDLGRIITFDMGGTSTDVSLYDGKPSLTREHTIDGYPVRTQVMDIHTVGAGGGSIAWIDKGGLLQVGPQSAGADPGPVCYGKGDSVTVTDANLFLGRLRADHFLGGMMHLDMERVKKKMTGLAADLGISVEETAYGIIRIVNISMAKAIRSVSLERGYNPEDFTLFGFGGASGLHCCELARDMGIKKIMIPARSGILSAQGMVYADAIFDLMQSLFLVNPCYGEADLEKTFQQLEQQAMRQYRKVANKNNKKALSINKYLNLRYQGQSYELTVPYREDFVERFYRLHKHNYGYHLENHPVELVSVQCTVISENPRQGLPRGSYGRQKVQQSFDTVDVWLSDGFQAIPLVPRSMLIEGDSLQGPALIIDTYTTILLPAGFSLIVDDLLNLNIQRAF